MEEKKLYPSAPKAVSEQIVVQEIGEELLVYNLNNHRAMNLNEPLAYIWKLCDGKRDVQEIKLAAEKKLKAPVPDEYINLSLAELDKHDLLIKIHPAGSSETVNPNFSRRDAIRRIGLTTAFALPIVTALAAPTAASAASNGLPLNATCTVNEQCQSTCCLAVCSPPSDCFGPP